MQDYAEMILNAYPSSSEETMFGNVIEDIAIAICRSAKEGKKSTALGIDLEYGNDYDRTIVQIKSGENWGNSSQKAKMQEYFKQASRILKQGGEDRHISCIEGICYGKSKTVEKGTYTTMVGNDFWKEISDHGGTAAKVMRILGKHAGDGYVNDIRERAKRAIVQYLNDNALAKRGEVLWDPLLVAILGKESS